MLSRSALRRVVDAAGVVPRLVSHPVTVRNKCPSGIVDRTRAAGICTPSHTPRKLLTCQGSAGDATSGDTHKGHAFLHDFCMSIPYGALSIAGGVALAFLLGPGFRYVGGIVAGAGAVVAAMSVLSLKTWKAGGSSTPYTLTSAGAASWVAWLCWQQVQRGAPAVWATGSLVALSAALALFCLYNVAAGGNPPPSLRASVPEAL